MKHFEKWWKSEGQYVRAGGGDYEKSFAFAAWNHTAKNAPAWHDAPTVPGTWILSLGSGIEVQQNITQHEIDIGATWPGGRWFGPIPPDSGEQS